MKGGSYLYYPGGYPDKKVVILLHLKLGIHLSNDRSEKTIFSEITGQKPIPKRMHWH
jgi:hypothetical protein